MPGDLASHPRRCWGWPGWLSTQIDEFHEATRRRESTTQAGTEDRISSHLLGDVSSFRALGENASRLADLIEGPTVTAEIATKRPGPAGSQDDLNGGFSDIFGYGPNPGAYVHPFPSGSDPDTRGWIGGTVGEIPGANLGETMAHELLGHTWAFVVGGAAPGSYDFVREAIWAENQVRRTDPARGLKFRHHDFVGELMTGEELGELSQ